MVYDVRMSEDEHTEDEIEEEKIEERQEAQAHGGTLTRKKDKQKESIMQFGVLWYGKSFEYFMKVGECLPMLAGFKDLYYQKKLADLKVSTKEVVLAFNETIKPERFHPYPTQLRNWVRKWDKDILEQLNYKKAELVKKGDVMQVIKTRAQDQSLAYGVPEDESLEAGVRTLAGELLNDGLQMLRDDQELAEIYDNDELIKRRTYVLNVLGHVTKTVHGKANIMLKASQEKRETASFLMDLMREAASGKLSKEKLDILKTTAVAPVVHEHVPANTG